MASNDDSLKKLLKEAMALEKSMPVASYCTKNFSTICTKKTSPDCVSMQILMILKRMWKCGIYTWDTEVRTSFYNLVSKFFRVSEKMNAKCKDFAAKEARINEETSGEIKKLYDTTVYSKMSTMMKTRNQIRSTARKPKKS